MLKGKQCAVHIPESTSLISGFPPGDAVGRATLPIPHPRRPHTHTTGLPLYSACITPTVPRFSSRDLCLCRVKKKQLQTHSKAHDKYKRAGNCCTIKHFEKLGSLPFRCRGVPFLRRKRSRLACRRKQQSGEDPAQKLTKKLSHGLCLVNLAPMGVCVEIQAERFCRIRGERPCL